jgi:TetR/AcrR family transcriptional repressor of nem operon
LRAFLDEIVEPSMTDKQRRGCMLVNSAPELAHHNLEFLEIVAAELSFIEEFFRRSIAAAQQDGTITSKREPGELAKVLLSVLFGIRVLARSRPQRSVLESVASGPLSLLKSET